MFSLAGKKAFVPRYSERLAGAYGWAEAFRSQGAEIAVIY
jgi:hypothetical protein